MYNLQLMQHLTSSICVIIFKCMLQMCCQTHPVVNIDNKCPEYLTQHPSVVLLVPPEINT